MNSKFKFTFRELQLHQILGNLPKLEIIYFENQLFHLAAIILLLQHHFIKRRGGIKLVYSPPFLHVPSQESEGSCILC